MVKGDGQLLNFSGCGKQLFGSDLLSPQLLESLQYSNQDLPILCRLHIQLQCAELNLKLAKIFGKYNCSLTTL